MSNSLSIRLDQFLKWNGWVGTGGEGKMVIQSGLVKVNGKVETRRGRQLVKGDKIYFGANSAHID